MGVLHFLDVGQGDCSIIKHLSGRITMIDVCKARTTTHTGLNALLGGTLPVQRPSLGALLQGPLPRSSLSPFDAAVLEAVRGAPASGSSLSPFDAVVRDALRAPSAPRSLLSEWASAPEHENPIAYMKAKGLDHIFRYIQTHPDMDHMDGLADLFAAFAPDNFWDTRNTCRKDFEGVTQYRKEDWSLYTSLRDGTARNPPLRLELYSGDQAPYFNRPGLEGGDHDHLHILAPTPWLVAEANRTGEFNDASYVVLWYSRAGRVLFCGDSHDKTWDHILANYGNTIAGVELMIAPHHGRDSDRTRDFLDVARPKLTLFGRAPSQHLAYDAWSNRGLGYITNFQAGTVIVDASQVPMQVFVAKEAFARRQNPRTQFSHAHQAWLLGVIG
jgi:beta-lactamase superfamily II metal-dependent hydrolase